MTGLPSNSPFDFSAHVLYDKYQGGPTEKSYSNYKKLCITFGKQAISYNDYKYWFKKYSKKTGRNLPDIRGCILSDVINGKSAGKSIDDLCKAFKNHKIDKEDHDYWYNRFDSGHLFTRVTFSDFPEDVLAEIVEKCDIQSYLNLRNVSFGLRTVIDQLAHPFTDIKVYCGTWVNVTLDGALLADSYFFKKVNRDLSKEFERRTLALLLRNPKLRLKSFSFFSSPGGYTKTVINLLNSLNRKIHVESCSIGVGSIEDLIGILQCFKPRKLEKIYLIGKEFARININEIVEMDQWKQAKHLESVDLILPSIEHLLHFSTIVARVYLIQQEDVIKLCKNLSKWTNYELIKLTILDPSETEEESVKRALNLQRTATPNVYSIPNSNMVIEFESSLW